MKALLLTATLLASLVAVSAHGATPNVPTLGPDALHPGQKAIVHTVFAGDSIETFEAEIVGVLRGGRASGNTILARALTPRVVQSGVAQGMSGSPVYVDGKLVGALSSGWGFSKEPIFGITPIGEMLDVLDAPDVPSAATAGPAGLEGTGPSPRAAFRELRWADDDTPAAAATPAASELASLPLPLAATGLHPGTLPWARELLGPMGFHVVPSGTRSSARDTSTLRPGSAVAVDVLRGDLNFSAIGTVTYRDGDRVLIFGHPFFGTGDVRLPLSTAEIVTILPSLNNSFKIGAPGRTVGTATQDRRAAVAGRLGPAPHLLPFRVRIEAAGRPARTYFFETIEDRALLAQLVGTAAVNSLLERGGETPQQSIAWSLDVYAPAGRRLHVEDLAAGESPVGDLVAGVSGPLRFLASNPFGRVAFDSLAITLRQAPGRDTWTLRQANLLTPQVRPGGRLGVQAEIERWRGGRESRVVHVPVPDELPPGRYQLWMGGGADLTRLEAARLPARYRPVSVADAWERLAASRPSTALYTAVWARSPEVTADGEDFPELPTSALAVMTPAQSAGDRQRRGDWALMTEQRFEVPGALRGEIVLEFEVSRQAP